MLEWPVHLTFRNGSRFRFTGQARPIYPGGKHNAAEATLNGVFI